MRHSFSALSVGLLLLCASASSAAATTAAANSAAPACVTATRLVDAPIIGPDLHPDIGANIQGPSLIQVPDWVPDRLGRYYLYFADHKGDHIRLAYADRLTGPWTVRAKGSLRLDQSLFPTEKLTVSDEEVAQHEARARAAGIRYEHDIRLELTSPHIASPDAHVDGPGRRIILYYHGLQRPGEQYTRVATSADGINFTAAPELLGPSYFRVFRHGDYHYALAMPGLLLRSRDGLTGFERGPTLFPSNQRHTALLKRGNQLFVFWTQVGDAPEKILLSRITLTDDWREWKASAPVEVLRPERAWEGANAPRIPSVRSTAYGQVNQLRDPAIFEEDGRTYLAYAVAGESGIGLAELHIDERHCGAGD